MYFIVKTNDLRYKYLSDLLSNNSIYSFLIPNSKITKIILPLEGLDEFGYIKGTNLKLETIFVDNDISLVVTGHINDYLKKLSLKYKFNIYSFYSDNDYLKNDFILKLEIIKLFLEETLNTSFADIKVLIVGESYNSIFASECLSKERKRTVNSIENYDVVINFSNDTFVIGNKIVIEMKEITDMDLQILLGGKNIFFINSMAKQYLTKSGGKLMYDSLVKS